MSMQPFETEIDPTQLVNTIIEKTKAGKLNWQETAKDDVFIVSVGGNTTMKVYAPDEYSSWTRLTLLNESGKVLMEVDERSVPSVGELFILARRLALKVDERIQSFIEVLHKL